jgi:hypothetical protein
MSFNPNEARDPHGKWTSTIRGLKIGESAVLPEGTTVKAVKSKHHLGSSRREFEIGGTTNSKRVKSAEEAATKSLDLSARSSHSGSLGGKTKYKHYADYRRKNS